jgi:signal recognition particle subunit SRP19
MSGKREKVVIWPVYFDSAKTRSQGRKVSAAEAVSNPTLEEIVTAALKLGLKPEVEREKMRPSEWHERQGRILLPKGELKGSLMRRMAGALRRKGRG